MTVRTYLQFALPILTEWATHVDSLREITRSDVERALADHRGRSEHNVHTALRSMFRGLKREKRIFSDPARGLVRHYARRLPRPLPSDRLRGLLDPLDHPREALIVAMVAIHALGIDELAGLRLVDLDRSAGTLTVARTHTIHRIILDETLIALAYDWLVYRAHRWPRTSNHHLLISDYTAKGDTPMSRYGITTGFRRIGISARQLRQDRIFDEAARTGDPVTLINVFGIGVTTAIRYIRAAHPEQFPGEPI
ncbi:site-specific integrase [Nocardia sp. CY41]|uniref:site-specific integrase n=1 Tax=Nocardia sp. CY41 TaxID=2608686 RepID=UPI00135BE554|nr:hypothetical protein [Nocardia sp. CY41]